LHCRDELLRWRGLHMFRGVAIQGALLHMLNQCAQSDRALHAPSCKSSCGLMVQTGC